MFMLKLHFLVAVLCSTLLFVSGRALDAQHRRYRRSLLIETLDGSVPDPLVVDYLDQYQVLKNALDKAERGTDRWLALVDETTIVSDYLQKLLQGYAIIVSVQSSSTTGIGGSTLTVASATTTPEGTSTGAPTTTSVDAPPTATPRGPVIVTVVPQPNTSIVVVASEGTTRTVTRGSQTRTAESPTATEAEQPAGEAEEREFPRSTTVTTSKGAVQTAVGASAGDETRPSSDARRVAVLNSNWWIVPAGLAGLLASIV